MRKSLSVLLVLFISIIAKAEIAYNITDLGTLGGSKSWVYGINDSGQVAGTSYLQGDSTIRAFLWNSGVITNLGSISWNSSGGQAINNHGQVTGYTATDSGTSHVFRYSDGVMTDLGTSFGGDGAGYGINNNGQIIGTSSGVNG